MSCFIVRDVRPMRPALWALKSWTWHFASSEILFVKTWASAPWLQRLKWAESEDLKISVA